MENAIAEIYRMLTNSLEHQTTRIEIEVTEDNNDDMNNGLKGNSGILY